MLCRSHGRGLTPLDSAHRAGKGRPTNPAIFFDLLKTDISRPAVEFDIELLIPVNPEEGQPRPRTINCEQNKTAGEDSGRARKTALYLYIILRVYYISFTTPFYFGYAATYSFYFFHRSRPRFSQADNFPH